MKKQYFFVALILYLNVISAQVPNISSFSPTSGPVNTIVTITGNNFSAIPSDNIVHFGAAKASVITATSKTLTVKVPIGTTYQQITVTTNNLTAYSNKPFDVTFPGGGTITTTSFGNNIDFNTTQIVSGFELPKNPYCISLGDFDEDGKVDLAVGNLLRKSLSILTNISNTGNISFSQGTVAAEDATVDIAVGDIDNDGKLDIITVNSEDSSISIFKNNSSSGNFSFPSKINLTTKISPNSIAIGDIDGDGKLDLAITNNSGNNNESTLSVFRNTSVIGSISFATRQDFNTDYYTNGVSIGEVDGDGKPDLVVIGYFNNGKISVFKNTSTGGSISFDPKMDFNLIGSPNKISMADLDADGKTDIAITNNFFGTTVDSFGVSILKNTSIIGTVSFAKVVNFSTGNNATGLSVGDIDGDGSPDLAVTSYSDNFVSVLKNTGISGTINSNSFAPKVQYSSRGGIGYNICIGDIDGDSKPEIAMANLDLNAISIFKNEVVEPKLISFTPTYGPTGTSITIIGTNLNDATAVIIGGVAATSFTILSATNIIAVIPTGASNGNVSVITPYGTATLGGFSRYAPPTITYFTPDSGPIGTTVDIVGSNFSTIIDSNIVYFGVVKAKITAATTTLLKVIVPVSTNFQNLSVSCNNLIAYSNKPFSVTFQGNKGIDSNSFALKVELSTESKPSRILSADWDGDGKLDLVTLNTNSFSIFKNISKTKGEINFASRYNLPTGTNPYDITIDDYDGDGKLDLAVVNFGDLNVSIFKNTSTVGSISFASKLDFLTSGGPVSISSRDLDEDGRSDLIITNFSVKTVSILRNTSSNGLISFASRVDLPTSTYPLGVCINDLNGDQKPDIAVTNLGTPPSAGNTISVFINTSINGVLSFETKKDFVTGNGPSNVSLGDLDGDGKSDIAVSNADRVSSPNPGNTISVLRNTSAGGITSFATKVDYKTGDAPLDLSMGDLDGDGKADLVVINNINPGTISVLNNLGSSIGSIMFSSKNDFAVGSYPQGLTLGDLDGDGKLDIAAVNYNDNTISILRNQISEPVITAFSPTSATPGTTITITGENFIGTSSVIIGGVVSNSFNVLSSTTITAVVPAQAMPGDINVTNQYGTGTLGGFTTSYPPTIISFTPTSGIIGTTVKITGTNFSPIDSNNIVYFGVVRATLLSATSTSLSVIVPIGANYFPITVTSNNLIAYSEKPFIVTFPGGSTGFTSNAFHLQEIVTPISHFPQLNAIGDLDGDGRSDLVVTNLLANYISKNVSVYKNNSTNGAISFDTNVDFDLGLGSASEVVFIGDLDGDGKLDFVATNYENNTVYVFRNTTTNGNISYSTPTKYLTGGKSLSVAIKDLNGDGKADLAVSTESGVSIFRNTSNQGYIAFAPKMDFPTDNNSIGISIADFDGDRKPDLAITNISSNTVSILRNISLNGMIAFSDKVNYVTANRPGLLSIGDLDGDDKVELIVPNSMSNTVSVFRNTSTVGIISFAEKIDYPTLGEPRTVSIADLNGDGNPDIIISNYGTDSISIFKNKSITGIISFEAKADYATGSGNKPFGVATGDMDGDGKIDIVTANPSGGFFSGSISILRNTIGPSQPKIFSFTPSSGSTGTIVTIKGLKFSGTTTVTFGGIAASSFNVLNDSTISAVVGSGASGSVLIKNLAGADSLTGFTFICPKGTAPSVTLQGDTILISSNSTYYQWYYNNKTLTGETANSYRVKKVGFYRVETSADKICWIASLDFPIIVISNRLPDTVSVQIYPNPASGVINVHVKLQKITGVITYVTVSDALGIQVKQTDKLIFFGNEVKIPITLNAGMYFVKVYINGDEKTIPVIVQ